MYYRYCCLFLQVITLPSSSLDQQTVDVNVKKFLYCSCATVLVMCTALSRATVRPGKPFFQSP